MQDRFAIGPVTIVQLVGLTTKPRIVSAQVDTAVRTADPIPPPSAGAGFGAVIDDMGTVVHDIENSYFNLKTPAAISLTAPVISGGISFDAAVDRPVSDASGQGAPQFIPLPDNIDLAGLIAALRGEAKPTIPAEAPPLAGIQPAISDNPPLAEPALAPADLSTPDGAAGSGGGKGDVLPASDATGLSDGEPLDPDFVFDGLESFGDDAILDFETYYVDAGLLLTIDPFGDPVADGQFAIDLAEHAGIDAGQDYGIDFAADALDMHWPAEADLALASSQFPPQPATDAAIVPV